MKEDADDFSRRRGEQSAGEMTEAEIDANVEGTFPASDPPAWTLGTNHRPARRREGENDDE